MIDNSTFWEASFVERRTMWGFDPAASALTTRDLFLQHGVKSVLIPGIGYGRNAKPFRDSGMAVNGIEVSQTAIDLAHQHFGADLPIHHGSVADMPFDSSTYDGIFAYGLIHLLDTEERQTFLRACYAQLAPGGHMVFTSVTKRAPMYGQGEQLGPNRFETTKGVGIYFYEPDAIHAEFDAIGLLDFTEITEPNHGRGINFWRIHCHKPA